MLRLTVAGRSRRILLITLSCLATAAGLVALAGSASATTTLNCSTSGTTLTVQVSGQTTSGTPLTISVSSTTPHDYVVAIGASSCTGPYAVSSYPNLNISSGSPQYVKLDDGNGSLASASAGCPVSISTSGLSATGNTVEVDGVSLANSPADATTAVGQPSSGTGALVTLSEAAGCGSPDVSLDAGVQTLVVNPGSGGSSLDLSSSPGSLTINSTTSPGTVTGFPSFGLTTIEFNNETSFVGPSAGGTTFETGTSTQKVTGQGSGNTLYLNGWSSPTVNVSGAPDMINSTVVPDKSVISGTTTSAFSGISTIQGPDAGNMTVLGRDTGLTFNGAGTGNVLDLSALPAGATIDAAGGSVSATGISESFNQYFGTFVGSAGGSTDFIAPDQSSTFQDGGSHNTVDLSALPTGATTNTTSIPVGGTGPGSATAGAVTINFASGNVSALTGSSSGQTTFYAGPTGVSFTGQGSGNQLNLSDGSFSGAVSVDQAAGTVTSGAGSFNFSGVTSLTGPSSGQTTFKPGSAAAANGSAFNANGASNTLDLSALTTPTVNANNRTLSAGTISDTFTDINSFLGSSTGSTTFIASGTSNGTFNGQGTGNKLDLSDMGTGTTVNVSGSGPSNNTATQSSLTQTFQNIQTVTGSSLGATTFLGGQNGVTLDGQGNGNILNLSALPAGATVDAAGGSASATGVSESFNQHFDTFIGSAGGSTDFIAPDRNTTFQDGGQHNTVDLSALPAGATVNTTTVPVAATVPDTATAGAATVDFTSGNVSTLIGSSGGDTTFWAGPTSGMSFTGHGSGNQLNLSNGTFSGGVTVDQTTGTVSSGAGSFSFSGLTSFTGPASGYTTFRPSSSAAAAGSAFNAGGANNTLDLADLTAPTLNANNQTLSAGTNNDTFTGIHTFLGSSTGNTTFITSGTSSGTYNGQGTGNELDLTSPAGATSLRVSLAPGACPGGVVTAPGTGLQDCFTTLSRIRGASNLPTTFVPDPNATSSSGVEFIGGDSSSGGSVLDLSGFSSPDASSQPVTGLSVSLGANTTASPGHVTASVGGTPVTFAAFASINQVIGSNSLSTGLAPGTASGVQLVNIAKAAQSLSFTSSPPSPAQVGHSYSPQLSRSTSGIPVLLSVDQSSGAGVCSVSGGVVSFTAAGACVIDANQAGNEEWTAAPQVQQKITVAPVSKPQIVKLLQSELTPIKGTTIRTLLAHGGSTLAVSSLLRGTLTVSWYWLPPGAHLGSAHRHPSPVLVGRGHHAFAGFGRGQLTVRLTRAGRKLLKRHRQLKLTGQAKFTAPGQPAVLVTGTFRLKH